MIIIIFLIQYKGWKRARQQSSASPSVWDHIINQTFNNLALEREVKYGNRKEEKERGFGCLHLSIWCFDWWGWQPPAIAAPRDPWRLQGQKWWRWWETRLHSLPNFRPLHSAPHENIHSKLYILVSISKSRK